MKINFLIPFIGLTGGNKVIFEYANRLSLRGHQITIIYPTNLLPNLSMKQLIFNYLKSWRRDILALWDRQLVFWFPFEKNIKIIKVRNLAAKNIPLGDICVATANETADWLLDYPVDRGRKFYFIQDYEDWSRPLEKVDATWKMPFKKIVIASWLKDLAKNKFREEVAGLIYDGVDLKIFNNLLTKNKNSRPKILMMYHKLAKKGVVDGLAAFQKAQEKYPEIELEMFGSYQPGPEVPANITFHRQPSPQKLSQLYHSADIFLWPSRYEGFGLPPLEAMACGCAVISTDTGAIREYACDGENVIIVPSNEPDQLAGALIDLLSNDEKRARLGKNASQAAQKFNWDNSTEKLEKIFLDNL